MRKYDLYFTENLKKTASQDQYLRVAKVHYSGPMRGDSCARGTIYCQHKAECCESGVRRRIKRPAAKLVVKSFWNALVAELRCSGYMSTEQGQYCSSWQISAALNYIEYPGIKVSWVWAQHGLIHCGMLRTPGGQGGPVSLHCWEDHVVIVHQVLYWTKWSSTPSGLVDEIV